MQRNYQESRGEVLWNFIVVSLDLDLGLDIGIAFIIGLEGLV